jgi:hypothetical protein
MIEILKFRLVPGADEAAFLAADRRLQTEFAYQQPGLMRRTTGRGADGEWIVIDIWRTEAEASAADERWREDPVADEFMAFIDRASVRTGRYATLD